MDRTTDTETQTHMGTHTRALTHVATQSNFNIRWRLVVWCMHVCVHNSTLFAAQKNCKPISDKLFANWSRKEKKNQPAAPNQMKKRRKKIHAKIGWHSFQSAHLAVGWRYFFLLLCIKYFYCSVSSKSGAESNNCCNFKHLSLARVRFGAPCILFNLNAYAPFMWRTPYSVLLPHLITCVVCTTLGHVLCCTRIKVKFKWMSLVLR